MLVRSGITGIAFVGVLKKGLCTVGFFVCRFSLSVRARGMWYITLLFLGLGRNRASGTTVNLQSLTLELSQELLLLMMDPTTSWLATIILVLVLVVLAASTQ